MLRVAALLKERPYAFGASLDFQMLEMDGRSSGLASLIKSEVPDDRRHSTDHC